jgi:hypothetical protein
MPACHLRHDRARCKRFRDDPLLVRVTPPSPATNATANLDASSRRGSINYRSNPAPIKRNGATAATPTGIAGSLANDSNAIATPAAAGRPCAAAPVASRISAVAGK